MSLEIIGSLPGRRGTSESGTFSPGFCPSGFCPSEFCPSSVADGRRGGSPTIDSGEIEFADDQIAEKVLRAALNERIKLLTINFANYTREPSEGIYTQS